MRFLYKEPAVLYKKALVIGDTHFGIEQRLKERGIYDETFSERIENKVEALIRETKAEKLIINGDVKDRIAVLDDTTKRILERLNEHVSELIIVKGNHDGGIEMSGFTVVPADGFAYHNLGIVHGHSWPNEKVMGCKHILSAHQHPQLEFRDKMGKRHIEPAWLIADADENEIKKHYESFNKKSKLVLMPAFNPLVGSTIKKSEHLGPILNNNLFKLNHALVFRVDGTLIGKLNEIK